VWDGDAPVLPAVRELKRREFLLELHGAKERTFSFKHALTRDVAYHGLLERRRREVHARAGAALERLYEGRLHEQYELLAYHYSRSADRARAADYLELANRKAAARHAMEEALGYFYEALAILESQPDSEAHRRRRLALVFDQTGEFHWLHRHQEFHDLLVRHEPLALSLPDAGVRGTFYARLAHRRLIFGEYEAAIETAQRALALCEEGGNAQDAALSFAVVEWASMMLGDYDRAIASFDEARGQLAGAFHPIWYMYAQAGAAMTHLMAGRWDAGLREIDALRATGAERSDNGLVSFADAIGCWVCLEARDWAGALARGNAAKEIAPTVYFRGFAFGFLASALCHTGAEEDGVPVLAQIASMIRPSRHELAWIMVAWRLADAYLAVGDLGRAKEVLLEIRESASRSGAKFFVGGSDRCLAEVALAERDVEEALRRLESALVPLRESRSENELALALAALGRARRLAGDDSAADAHLQEALAIFERLGTGDEPDRVRHELATHAV
jgi:tetratricopeptide (TPR) repeat protein